MGNPDKEPKIYLLPNLMTAGNLCCGFFAVLTIFKGMQMAEFEDAKHYYETSLLLIFGACLFDLLDGRLARLGGQESDFGREFDSLADLVSFGMAPAMLCSKAVLLNLELPDEFQRAEPGVGWSIAFIYLLCGAIRLARFNCLAAIGNEEDMKTFRGIPIPMAAGFIASLTFLIIYLQDNDRHLGPWNWVLAGAMLGLSFLMISNIRYPSFKRVGWSTRASVPLLAVGTIFVGATVAYYWILPAVWFSAYLIYGLIRPLLSVQRRKAMEEVLDSEADDQGQGD